MLIVFFTCVATSEDNGELLKHNRFVCVFQANECPITSYARMQQLQNILTLKCIDHNWSVLVTTFMKVVELLNWENCSVQQYNEKTRQSK